MLHWGIETKTWRNATCPYLSPSTPAFYQAVKTIVISFRIFKQAYDTQEDDDITIAVRKIIMLSAKKKRFLDLLHQHPQLQIITSSSVFNRTKHRRDGWTPSSSGSSCPRLLLPTHVQYRSPCNHQRAIASGGCCRCLPTLYQP